MTTRRAYFTWAGISLLFAAMLGGLLWLQQNEAGTFRTEGLPAEARVTGMSETVNIANDTTTYTLSLAYMQREGTAGGAEGSVLEGTFALSEIEVGTFQRARAEVRGPSYDALAVGDTVAIYYLPDQPQKAMLAAEADGYRAGLLGVVTLLLLGATAMLLLLGLIQRLRLGPGPAKAREGAAGG